MNKRIIYLSLLLGWILITGYLLLSPSPIPDLNEKFAPANTDKAVHFGIFGIMSFLFFKVYKEYKIPKIVLYSFLSALLLGIVFESLQYFVPLRTVSIYDMMFNTLGSSVVFLFSKKI